jgi:putative endonuclease
MWKVYFLKSVKKNWYYVGSTSDLSRRVKEHNQGKVKSTKIYLPLELVHEIECINEKEARYLEKKIKNKRLLKEEIIRTIKL